MHIITLSFDDGFAKSCVNIARIYEKFGLSACFNVLAGVQLPQWVSPDQYMSREIMGDFDLWNDLRARGHEVMPHGFEHANKAAIPFEDAQSLILRCLDMFDARLNGFNRQTAVFNFPYNSSTPEIDAWILTQVRAIRTGGTPHGILPLPTRQTTRLPSASYGPGNADEALDLAVQTVLKQPDGWLLYCLHGLDEEGWGPISSDYLERLLARLVEIPSVTILPAGRVLEKIDGRA